MQLNNLEIEVSIHSRTRIDVASRPLPRIPRLARLVALAIKFQDMIDRGEVSDYAELARLGHVSRARLTQIMNLTLLAPSIQEALLFGTHSDTAERELRPICRLARWSDQLPRFLAHPW